MTASYTAQEVAKYVVSQCYGSERPVDNLKLQKMLYFLWIDYYKSGRGFLFDDRIEAWKYGPVIPAVYMKYRSFIADPICVVEKDELSQPDRTFLSPLVERYNKRSSASLVRETHESGSPWYRVYKNGEGMREAIPYKDIVSFVESKLQGCAGVE